MHENSRPIKCTKDMCCLVLRYVRTEFKFGRNRPFSLLEEILNSEVNLADECDEYNNLFILS